MRGQSRSPPAEYDAFVQQKRIEMLAVVVGCPLLASGVVSALTDQPLSTERASKPWIGFLPTLHYPSIIGSIM